MMAASMAAIVFFIPISSQYSEFRECLIFDFKQIITIFAEFCIISAKTLSDEIKTNKNINHAKS